MKIGEIKETSLSPVILTTFFAIFCFKLPIHYRPNKFTIFWFIIDAYFLTKKSQKFNEKKHGFIAVHLQFFKRKYIFFWGGGIFTKFGGGAICPTAKEKSNISRE